MTIAGKVGAVFLQTEDVHETFIKEAATANIEFTHYTITDELCRYLDRNSPITVYINDVQYNGNFEARHLGGVIIFPVPLLGTDTVTVSGKSIRVDQAGGFFSWSADLSSDTVDVSTFESGGWKENLPTINGFTAAAESYWADERLSSRLGQEVIIALYLDTGTNKKRYEGYGRISGDSIKLSADGVVNESIEFEGSGKLYYRED
ncbi:phage tail protein [Metallumcola ferriviriculae]|uniref:Phage tail protein n=1 Tax=Metallumcola ferriviriculae TaxID=3039180 RepID=A0AAU0UMA6_9FIRM|nr:phage tail protein [Desulfitibacteraceae bacterium MK1]